MSRDAHTPTVGWRTTKPRYPTDGLIRDTHLARGLQIYTEDEGIGTSGNVLYLGPGTQQYSMHREL